MTIKKCYPKKSIMLKLTYANKPYLQQHISNNWFKKSSIVNLISPYNVWVQEILFKDSEREKNQKKQNPVPECTGRISLYSTYLYKDLSHQC